MMVIEPKHVGAVLV